MSSQKQALVLSASPMHKRELRSGCRLFRLCEAIKSQGVNVDILYYPVHWAWQQQSLTSHMQKMRDVADEVFVVPISLSQSDIPATAAGGTGMALDPSIGIYLDWLFQVRAYTHVFVNAAWLGRAFDHVPPAIVKIFDAPRDLHSEPVLWRHPGQNAAGPAGKQISACLELPDFVLAPNARERDRLAGLTGRTVLTVSPASPAASMPLSPGDALGLPLRVGLMAPPRAEQLPAFVDFLSQLVLSALRTMSPLTVLVHDNAARTFQVNRPDLAGLTTVSDDIDAFYDSIDLVIVPPGVGEIGEADERLALSGALPVLAIGPPGGWIDENYPTQFAENATDLIRVSIDLSFDANAFAELRRHAAAQNDQRVLHFRAALNRLLAEPNGICSIVVATKAIANPQSSEGNRLADIVDCLAELGTVYIYIADRLTDAEQTAFASLPLPATMLLSYSATPHHSYNRLLSVSLAALVAAVPAQVIWLASAHDPDLVSLAATGASIVVDTLLLGSSIALLDRRIVAARCFVAHYPGDFSWQSVWRQLNNEHQLALPFFRHFRAEMHDSWRDPCQAEGVWMLCDDTEWSVLREIASDAGLKAYLREATLVVTRQTGPVNGPARRLLLSDLAANLQIIGPRPCACLDLCETNMEFTFVREIMLRFDVPLIPIGSLREEMTRISCGSGREPSSHLASLPGAASFAAAPTRVLFENDAGWCTLRRLVHAKAPRRPVQANT